MATFTNLEARAVSVQSTADTLTVTLVDGRVLSAPLSWFPRLQHASQEARDNWRLLGDGEGIHWESIDEDISVPRLLGLPTD
jgi:hypothetical protein